MYTIVVSVHPVACSVRGQRFYDASNGECVPCSGTCAEPNPVCTKDCRSGCACPPGTVLNDEGTECIHPRTCPRKCELLSSTFRVLFIFILSTDLYFFTAIFGVGLYHNQTYQPGDKWNCTESDECMFWLVHEHEPNSIIHTLACIHVPIYSLLLFPVQLVPEQWGCWQTHNWLS